MEYLLFDISVTIEEYDYNFRNDLDIYELEECIINQLNHHVIAVYVTKTHRCEFEDLYNLDDEKKRKSLDRIKNQLNTLILPP